MLNENIRNLRKAKGLSHEELAIKLNGKKVYLSPILVCLFRWQKN
ncbi:hypothetical protein [Amedibacillus dolichus]|nr:hypothetical protein [Amedibacillus dolichus]